MAVTSACMRGRTTNDADISRGAVSYVWHSYPYPFRSYPVMPECIPTSVPDTPEYVETHVETHRDCWEDFGRWKQLLQVVAHLTSVTGENYDEDRPCV